MIYVINAIGMALRGVCKYHVGHTGTTGHTEYFLVCKVGSFPMDCMWSA